MTETSTAPKSLRLPPGTPDSGPVTVRPGDARYGELTVGNNRRFTAAPDAVHLVRTTEQAVHAVRAAVHAGKRVSVRSGGHCYADFVYSRQTEVILDLSTMDDIRWDPERDAFMVEPGAQLGDVYETLYRGWGVVVPGGVCLGVGVGGHACGGGYGLLSRRYGVVVDHIQAVEVVVVGADGEVRAVVATRDPRDPHHDLWWASAGGGGGNFGVITRYWFRSVGTPDHDPGRQLPRPPADVLLHRTQLPWDATDQETFTRLLCNFGRWHEKHAGYDSAYTALAGAVFVAHKSSGAINLQTQMDATLPGAEALLADYLAEVTAGTGITMGPAVRLPWLAATKQIGTAVPPLLTDPTKRSAAKSAYMRSSFTEDQAAAVYRAMTRDDYANPNATLQLYGVAGGQVNAVSPAATAYPHRQSAYLSLFEVFWDSPQEDAQNLGWIREVYRQTFASTGGYPDPGGAADGCYINSPDPDVLDPEWNTSGLAWHELYYQENYPRLQRVKAQWDPTDFFRHALSVALPGA